MNFYSLISLDSGFSSSPRIESATDPTTDSSVEISPASQDPPPDIKLNYTMKDYMSGKDREIEQVREIVKTNGAY